VLVVVLFVLMVELVVVLGFVVLVAFAVVELAVVLVELPTRLKRLEIDCETMVPLGSEEYCQNITPVHHLLY